MCRTLDSRRLRLRLVLHLAIALWLGGCGGAMRVWDKPPAPRLGHEALRTTERDNLAAMSRLALRRARAVPSSAERVIWYGRAGVAQYRMARGEVPLQRQLLRDDPTGMVATDLAEDANDLERRHHPHLFDCTSWLRQVPEAQKSNLVRAWAAHCAFRVAEVRAWLARAIGLPQTFDGTMPRRLLALDSAVKRAVEAAREAQRLAVAAKQDRLSLAAVARAVMVYAHFSAAIIAVPMPASYASAPRTAALLRAKQRQLAVPIADKARRLLRQLNRSPLARRWPSDPWLRAARRSVLKAPREGLEPARSAP